MVVNEIWYQIIKSTSGTFAERGYKGADLNEISRR